MYRTTEELNGIGVQTDLAPRHWRNSCANTEPTIHQLSPYIGKIKSRIAGELVDRYSQEGELVVDPFAGAGTIPVEAVLRGRRAFGSDISPYAGILSRAKLFPPSSLNEALKIAGEVLDKAEKLPKPDLRSVPEWVRRFFHPNTLRAALNFAQVARSEGHDFLMACFLGILHHQRPGFLSYPSSHLVPYLRNKKFPPAEYPEMYKERELRPRLLSKIERSYRRFSLPRRKHVTFCESAIQEVALPKSFDALITSPPYMNALDYGRDNRLRLWFIDPTLSVTVDNDVTKKKASFEDAIINLGRKVEVGLKGGGYCVFIVGVASTRKFETHPSEIVLEVLKKEAPSLRLIQRVLDDIPDLRRSRRECRGVKAEHILILRKK